MTANEPSAADRGVLCIREAHWLRWDGDILEVGENGQAGTLAVRAADLMLVGRAFGPLESALGDGRRLALAARFAAGATILVERRGECTAVAASPLPRPRAVG